jgi:hypothetical protein
VRWNIWRSALAGALIGFVEAAGLAAIRPAPRVPLRLVRPAGRVPSNPLSRCGVWFLDPLPLPRRELLGRRRPARGTALSIVVPRRWSVRTRPLADLEPGEETQS